MENLAHSENGATLILDSRVSLEYYRIYWFFSFKKSLPNTIIFWGILTAGALLIAFLLRNSLLGFLVFLIIAIVVFLIPVLMLLFSYQDFMSAHKKYLAKLSESEKHFNLIFKFNSDGFECVNGKNFSHISWSSIENAVENKDFFVLSLKNSPFIIPKCDFKNEDELKDFRLILSTNLGNKVKLLNQ